MIYRTSTLVLLTLTLVLAISATAAGPRPYRGEGVAVVIDDDLAAAGKLAFIAARRDAIGKAMDKLAERRKIDPHDYNIKREEIFRGDFPFVTAERIVSRDQNGTVLKVTLELAIDEAALMRSLGAQGLATGRQKERRKSQFPTVVVVIGEELNGARNRFPYSTQVIQERLREAEYRLVDRAVAEQAVKHDEAVQAVLSGDLRSARAVALQTRAGVLIAGHAVAQKSGVQSGAMQAFGATVAIQAVAADSGRVIASVTTDGSYPHVNALQGSRRAIEEAAEKAIEELLRKLEGEHESQALALDVSIEGVNFEQLAILKKIIRRDFPEVTEIRNRSFTGDVANLELDVTGGATVEFAERLALHDFEAFDLRVLSLSPGKLDVKLVAPGVTG